MFGVVLGDLGCFDGDDMPVGASQCDARTGLPAHDLEITAVDPEEAACRGLRAVALVGEVITMRGEDSPATLPAHLDIQGSGRVASALGGFELEIKAVCLGVPRLLVGHAPAAGFRLEEAIVDAHPLAKEVEDHPVVKVDCHAHCLLLEPGVEVHDLPDDTLLVGESGGDGDEYLVVCIVGSQRVLGYLDFDCAHVFDEKAGRYGCRVALPD